ncbi:bifunctional prephenate dehydrogenase/3-phosphoshikimate 1-carboxyvinyltransferase [Venatoribacter cucullus]|uniref:bifunctional prephenate dehydrogenase/3-phosphoshikimate 1-carboxyvinyltransferase n=1 Tax=Venatoribacter cucullus TaxID=2661630 RepID=UPI00223FE16F|nr:bifunctional prephenate dehydrogenase/3-phosphoshikimate 1-carboxyvinyltransferase [Venatoribacter cucullus]UZK03952.1 bifunctional prephenate dehydrogenase/3-phosphoshikimate 1-carboxyvinyltransferase [Venatoribacter cucullus]
MSAETPFFIPRLSIIGLGLIGCSWAKGLRVRGCVGEVLGYDRNLDSMQEALTSGIIDRISPDLAAAVEGADLVVISVPILAVRPVLQEIAPHLAAHAVITDVGSVKGSVADDVAAVFGADFPRFVLGHPIAGSERSGVNAADENLYVRHKVIITPQPHTDKTALRLVRRAWRAVEADVESMDVVHHDEVLAATSHLPHLLAYSLVDTLANTHENKEIFNYAAGGFRDFTRIAASSPVMWRDIFSANKTQILKTLDLFTHDLHFLRAAIEADDTTTVMGVLTRAKVARDHFSKILARRAYVEPMKTASVTYIASPSGALTGTFRVPGDKSISHRSIMLGSLAEGTTEVSGFLEGEDSLATLQAFRDMGVVIEGPHRGRVTIHGVGLHGLQPPPGPLYLGNSGTSMRLLAGLMAGQTFDVEMSGDASLSKRPMGRVADPLKRMGAVVDTADGGRPPIKVHGAGKLTGIHYDLPMASAQVKSCVLLAGLYAEGETSVTEPAPTRDHTERMLKGFGYDVQVNGNTVTLRSGGKLTATNIDVPADISSAAFFMVGASIAEGSDITLEHVGMNPTRDGIINILRAMGGNIEVLNPREVGGEPVADIRIRSARLKGIHIPEDQVPLAIDEFPALFIAAACAEGETILTGAEELRVKESDRIQVMIDGLTTLGVQAEGTVDGAIIQGLGHNGLLGGGEVISHGDHRIAMSFAMASLRASSAITILDCANVATSFPGFVDLANNAGLELDVLTTKA